MSNFILIPYKGSTSLLMSPTNKSALQARNGVKYIFQFLRWYNSLYFIWSCLYRWAKPVVFYCNLFVYKCHPWDFSIY